MSQIEDEQGLRLEGMFASQPFMHLPEVTSLSPGRGAVTPEQDQLHGSGPPPTAGCESSGPPAPEIAAT
jgi:hypothetical protein